MIGSHSVCGYSKLLWWLTGPSGIGAAHLDRRIKVAMFDLQALSAFGYFGNGLTVPSQLAVTQKLFWWLTGPSGIGAAHLDRRIKVAMFDLQALSAFGYFGNGLTVPTGSHPVTQKLFGG